MPSITSEQQREVRFSEVCRAPAEVVYDLLADLTTHLDWGGSRQAWYFRLLSMDGPREPMQVGAQFSSSGAIPGTRRRFADRSQITLAQRPVAVEFVTQSSVHGRRTMEATYRHRYDLDPVPGGCRVTYAFRQERLVNPLLRMALPVVRDVVWKVGIPMMMKRGYRNLLRAAEQAVADSAERSHQPSPSSSG